MIVLTVYTLDSLCQTRDCTRNHHMNLKIVLFNQQIKSNKSLLVYFTVSLIRNEEL